MKLNEKIIKLRKEKGVSQEEFGNEINVSRQAISKWEMGQTKPDIDKLKEIAKFFNVSYEYLLDDECETIEKDKPKNSKNPKFKKIFLKMIIILLTIYLLSSLYKLIGLIKFYKIANSFSENNYLMMETFTVDGEDVLDYVTQKIDDKIIKYTSNSENKEDSITNENGELIPYIIEYIDTETKEWYDLYYEMETHSYRYKKNGIEDVETIDDFNSIVNGERNYLKELTLSYIPSKFKDILLISLNPIYRVSIAKNEIYMNNFNKTKMFIKLTKDCLLENYVLETEFNKTVGENVSYDYVQDHFNNKIVAPLELYKDKISNIEDIK